MYKFISLAKAKALPAVIAAIFVAGTAFLSSAAAQKMIHAAVPPQSQKSESKKPQKISQTTVADANAESSAGAGSESGSFLRTAASGAVLAAITTPAGQGDNSTSNSTVASTTAQAVNSNNTQNNQGNAVASTGANITTVPAKSTTSSNNTNSGASSGNTFTLQTLAQHNKSGDCYIAYKGTVYDLSSAASWANCQHHGATGGIDVTSMFPHPVSYFNSVPVAGTLVTTSATSGQAAGSGTSQNSQAAAASGAANSTSTSTQAGSGSSGSGGTSAGSVNTGTRAANRSVWGDDDDGFVRSRTNVYRQSRYGDDDESGE